MKKRLLTVSILLAVVASGAAQVKLVDSFDSACWEPTVGAGPGCDGTAMTMEVSKEDFIEGEGCFSLAFSFGGKEPGEYAYLQRIFTNFRCDFSYCPKSLSMWVKGQKGNKGVLRVVLLQGDMRDRRTRTKALQTYQFTDSKILKSGRWTRLEMPFSAFTPLEAGDVPLDLSQVIGWRIDVVNPDGKPSEGNVFLVDRMEQNTTAPRPSGEPARLTSLIIQPNKGLYGKTDWEQAMRSVKELGIDTWFIQFSLGRKAASKIAFYRNCSLPWVTERLDHIDTMFAAAEKLGMKIIIGPYYESWGHFWELAKEERYDEVFEKNRLVIDDIAANFASSPAFAGWYIANEFHDGSKARNTWYDEPENALLAAYLEKTARYMKSLKDIPVVVSPALFRGFPARMTGDMYDRLFSRAPSLDRLYLQDCSGRGGDMITSVTVDLPNYFAEIKKACDRNGVEFCVNAESFFRCDIMKQPRRPKTWEEFRSQLVAAGAFTDEVTSFSWFSFMPGQQTWEGYKKHFEGK